MSKLRLSFAKRAAQRVITVVEMLCALNRPLRGLAAAGLALALGCGSPSDTRLRVLVQGTGEDTSSVASGKAVWITSHIAVSSALVRIARAAVTVDGSTVQGDAPVNVDLLASTIVIERPVKPGKITRVTLEVPQPAGEGVVRGEAIGVYVAGLVRDTEFEYRDRSMDPLELPVDKELSDQSLVLKVDLRLQEWLHELEEDDLEPDPSGRFLIDDNHNAAVAARVEAKLRAAVALEVEELDCAECDDD